MPEFDLPAYSPDRKTRAKAEGSSKSTITLILHIIVWLCRYRLREKRKFSEKINVYGVSRMGYRKVCTCAQFFVPREKSSIKYGSLTI